MLAIVSVGPLIVAFTWFKFRIALFDDYEMKHVALGCFIVSFFCSLFIWMHNGKVETYFSSLFLKGKTVSYQKYIDERSNMKDAKQSRRTTKLHTASNRTRKDTGL